MKYKIGDKLVHKDAKYYMKVIEVDIDSVRIEWSDDGMKSTIAIVEIEDKGWYRPTKLHKALS